jgi:hypothetical protein
MKYTVDDLTLDSTFSPTSAAAAAAVASAKSLQAVHAKPSPDGQEFSPDWVPKHSPRVTTYELGQHLKHLLITDRADALDTLKTMPIGKSFYIDHLHANNVRVACHYNRKHYLKTYRTETVEYSKHQYLRVTRTR